MKMQTNISFYWTFFMIFFNKINFFAFSFFNIFPKSISIKIKQIFKSIFYPAFSNLII
ncbi:hypothetical protein MYF_02600 [Mesomycoplasma flocculare ATCC 27399]|uniref:Uncharacterized protein n=1 Tax=Mesomycoplasma flocculare ATCC 27399 TaxID=743971 RepID=A0A0A8E727_MESFC|nr:hypothetical protein MYF_02600 [Mesomycoplasma flocculare ATCC 27399]